jgi:hypothetical protein
MKTRGKVIMTSNNTPLPGPGRKLDRLVAERIGLKYIPATKGGWPEHVEFPDKPGQFVELLDYSTDIAAAWQVVEFMRSKGYRFHIYEHDRKSPGDDFVGWVAGFTSRDEMKVNSQWQGDTPAHAICLAFLAIPELV